jgi:copper transport protein
MIELRRTRTRPVGRIVLGMAIVLAIPWAGRASAHTFVESTKPKAGSTEREAPRFVVMHFTEPVEVGFGGIEVFAPGGARADVGETEYVEGDETTLRVGLADDLPNGRYVVEWRVVAADGHPREGRFPFHLEQPSPSPTSSASPPPVMESPASGGMGTVPHSREGAGPLPEILFGVARWFLFASLLLLVGMGGFALLVWRPAAGLARPPEVEESFWRRWRHVMVWAWVAAMMASAVSLVFEGSVAADVPLTDALSTDILAAVLGTRFGAVTAIRFAVLGLLGGLFLRAGVASARRVLVPAGVTRSLGAAAASSEVPRSSVIVWGLVGVVVLATVSLAGHAGSFSPVVLGVTVDVVHLLAGALWIGGLVGLVGVAMPATRRAGERARVAILAPVVSRFSNMALLSVTALVLTGAVRGWMEIRTLAALTGEAYGVALLVKLAVVVPLVVLGAINNRWTRPRIRRAAEDASLAESGARGVRMLGRLVLAEVLLAVAVLAVTAVLVNQAPPVDAMGGGH